MTTSPEAPNPASHEQQDTPAPDQGTELPETYHELVAQLTDELGSRFKALTGDQGNSSPEQVQFAVRLIISNAALKGYELGQRLAREEAVRSILAHSTLYG